MVWLLLSHISSWGRVVAMSGIKQTFAGILAVGLAGVVYGADVISMWGGGRHTIVLKSDGTVWNWGSNLGGELGTGPATTNHALAPVEVHGSGDIDFLHSISAIMGGEAHNVALKSDGTVWTWGYNGMGQLGDGTTNNEALPVPAGLNAVPPLTTVTKLGGRTYWNLAVKSDGSMWAWGMGQSGQMGNGGTTNCLNPVRVGNSQPGGAVNSPRQVSCGFTYGVALLTNGTVWTWGTGGSGELGNGANSQNYVPTQIPVLSNITAISTGWKHTIALKADGTVWAWGKNQGGEVGDGTTANRSNAVQVLNLSNIVAVSGGDYNSIALRSDGTVWKWGGNQQGELGIGSADTDAHPFPAQVTLDIFGAGFSNVVMVANRDYHNIAVKADGSVWQWGANDQGQCGVGTTNDVYRPAPVIGMGTRVPRPLNINGSGQPGSIDLSWSSATGEYFTIEYATNLANGFSGVWQANVLATPPANVVTVGGTNGNRYYRLKF
jgi:alpha-tubulin suppressor-like RCC1 family protein